MKLNRLHTILSLGVATSLLLGSCGGGKTSATDSDSLRQAAEETEKAAEEHLPDTAYSSTEVLKYDIEIADSTDGRLASLRDLYSEAPGIMTFRGGPRRDAPFTGKLATAPSAVTVAWTFTTSESKNWGGGTGWTGQPLYVKWPADKAKAMQAKGLMTGDFRGEEIIVGSLDGKVYFIDPESGKATREAIDTGNPIKGTVSLDPSLNGYLYVGQGIPEVSPFGAYTIDLNSNEIISKFGVDPKARRNWGAYDSSAVRVGQFVFRPGENGTLYKWLPGADGMHLHSALRYSIGGAAAGIESSLGVWRNYGYFGDNAGHIICVNLDTMRPVWHYDNHDDTDASPVVSEENGRAYIYTGCEVDKQGEGYGYLVKLDALDGSKVWEAKIPGRLHSIEKKHFDGGFYGTPLPGRGNCEGLLFANVVSNIPASAGDIMAFDMNSGKTVWQTRLRTYAWSSPIALTTPDGTMYILTGDTAGNLYIINGKNGEILLRERIGDNFESSPIVVGNNVYLGTRGRRIFKITIS